MATFSVFVLRGQPVHKAHIQIIRNGLKESDYVVAVLGSYRTPKTIKNPWSFEDRKDFIRGSLTADENKHVEITNLRDYLYSDTTWVTSLQNIVSRIVPFDAKVVLYGHFKDDSSYYLNFFPQWELRPQPAILEKGVLVDGTDIRRAMYEDQDDYWPWFVSNHVRDKLMEFKKTEEFQRLKREYKYIMDYKKSWASAPFPPVFVTTDSVVVQAGHILLITRGTEPGKGCYAIPGGFLGQNETIEDGTIRELREETKIAIPAAALRRYVRETKVFDHPKRSSRGRSITHASLFVLDPDKALPKVKGDDDADSAFWMPINDINLHEENFFEDHLSIIQYFITKI